MEYGNNSLSRFVSPVPPRVGSPLRIDAFGAAKPPSIDLLLHGHSHIRAFREPTTSHTSTAHGLHMNSMARRWIRWLVKYGNNKTWTTLSILILAVLTRWFVGLGSYSGSQLCYLSSNILTYAKGRDPLLFTETTRHSVIGWN